MGSLAQSAGHRCLPAGPGLASARQQGPAAARPRCGEGGPAVPGAHGLDGAHGVVQDPEGHREKAEQHRQYDYARRGRRGHGAL